MRNVSRKGLNAMVLSMLLLVFLWSSQAFPKASPEDVKCLTDNIYWEAQGESLAGMVWVAQSVMTRVKDPRWPNTICKVIYQPSQYSWTLEPTGPILWPNEYNDAREIAEGFLLDPYPLKAIPVTNYLRCDWRHKVDWWKSMTFKGRIGAHCFYYD